MTRWPVSRSGAVPSVIDGCHPSDAANDWNDVKNMIDRSLAARNRGRVVIDLRGESDEDGNNWLRTAAMLMPAERVTIDEADSNPIVAFLDALLNDAENFAPPDCALPIFDVTSGILASSNSGKPVTLSDRQ